MIPSKVTSLKNLFLMDPNNTTVYKQHTYGRRIVYQKLYQQAKKSSIEAFDKIQSKNLVINTDIDLNIQPDITRADYPDFEMKDNPINKGRNLSIIRRSTPPKKKGGAPRQSETT